MLRFNSTLPVDLLPPPSGDTNVDLTHLSDFLSRLVRPQITQSTVDQFYVCMAIISFLMVIGVSMILHRLISGRAWFLKLWHVSGGTFVIPNCVIAFLACEACFGANWIIYAFVTIRHYQLHNFQTTYLVYKAVTFCPLWVGGWWTAFGVVGAFPDALTHKIKGSKQKRLLVSPLVFNVACWGGPVVQTCSLLVPAFVAVRNNVSATNGFDRWHDDVFAALQQGSVSGATYDELHARALQIWLTITETYWWYSVVMVCWVAWALLVLVVYVPMGGHVLLRIRRKFKIERNKKHVAAGRAAPTAAAGLECNFNLDPQDVQDQKDRFGTTTSRVFPPLKEPTTPTTSHRKSMQASRTPEERRLRNLRRLLVNLAVQYFGIWVAVMCFVTAAGMVAFQIYDAARRNYIMRVEAQTNLFGAWSMVLFASLIFWCIFQRSFDPSLSIDLAEEEPSPIAPRSTWSMFVKPFLPASRRDSGRQIIDSRSVDNGDIESVLSSPPEERARKHSEGGTSYGQSGASVVIVVTDEEKGHCRESDAITPPAVTLDVSGAPTQSATLDQSPTPMGSTKGLLDDTIDVSYATPAPPGKVTVSSGVTLPESPLHDTIRLADAPTHCVAPPRADDQGVEIASLRSELLKAFTSLHKPPAAGVRQRSGTMSQTSASAALRRPATASECTAGFVPLSRWPARSNSVREPKLRSSVSMDQLSSREVESSLKNGVPLLDMEAKCFVPPNSHVEAGEPRADSERDPTA